MFKTDKGKIILVGDSLLDNFLYLEDKNQDLKKELEQLGFAVENYAVAGALLKDLTYGLKPSLDSQSRNYKYLTKSDGKVYQIELLQRPEIFKPIYSNVLADPPMTVISIGGNDLQQDVMRIIYGIENFVNDTLNAEFRAHYENLIKTAIECRGDKVLIVSMYLPYLGTGSTYGIFSDISKSIINYWKRFLLPLAHKYNVPVLDLSQTFDSLNRLNYGLNETHPSNLGNRCLAQSINYIYDNYDGYGVYYAPKGNISHMEVSYEH